VIVGEQLMGRGRDCERSIGACGRHIRICIGWLHVGESQCTDEMWNDLGGCVHLIERMVDRL